MCFSYVLLQDKHDCFDLIHVTGQTIILKAPTTFLSPPPLEQVYETSWFKQLFSKLYFMDKQWKSEICE